MNPEEMALACGGFKFSDITSRDFSKIGIYCPSYCLKLLLLYCFRFLTFLSQFHMMVRAKIGTYVYIDLIFKKTYGPFHVKTVK